MTQDPNAEAQIEPTEVGANAAETGERSSINGEVPDAYGSHEVGDREPRLRDAWPRWATRPPSSTPTLPRCSRSTTSRCTSR